MKLSFRAGLAAVVALGFGATAHAQPIPATPAVPAEPQVIKWPGGVVVVNGSEVIVRQSTPGRSTNIVTGAGNGVGNKIVVDGGAGGVTIVRGSRVGVGNKIVVDPDDLFIDLDALLCKPKPAPLNPMVPPKAAPGDPLLPAEVVPAPLPAPAAPPSYKGKANVFWSKKAFSDALDCNLYWCPTAKLWFRYQADDDTYRPAATQPPAPVEEK